jgi:hypothetical protein
MLTLQVGEQFLLRRKITLGLRHAAAQSPHLAIHSIEVQQTFDNGHVRSGEIRVVPHNKPA